MKSQLEKELALVRGLVEEFLEDDPFPETVRPPALREAVRLGEITLSYGDTVYATVPLLGFGHLLAQGVVDAVEKSGLLGALCGGFSAAAAGVTASLVCGVLAAAFSHSKDQN